MCMTYIEKLDTILRILCEDKRFKNPFEIHVYLNHIRNDNIGISDFESAAILRKLVRDSLVDMNSVAAAQMQYVTYLASIEGLIMVNENGGYINAKKSSSQLTESKEAEAKNWVIASDANQMRLNYLTAILAVATLALGVSEGMKIYATDNQHFYLYLTIIAAIILMVVTVLTYTKKSSKSVNLIQ